MKFLYILLLSSIAVPALAQSSWKVNLNGKVVLNTSTEDEGKNVIKISASDLKKDKSFIISYSNDKQTADQQKGWERTIMLYDTADKELKKITGTKLTMTNASLKTLFKKSKSIKIYTWALPTDPKMKSQIRIRRVHLCTLTLQ
jgi:hypothetical protein